MRIRIDLKILIFLVLFFLTKQIDVYITMLVFCAIHEFGHIAVGMILKLKPEKLEILPYGLSISFNVNPNDINKKIKNGSLLEIKKILVALAGPTVSLILAIIFSYINPIFITRQDAVYSNILILLFNLMPIYPLDGGRILKYILHIKYGNKKSKKYINEISNVSMLFLTFVCSIAIVYLKNIAYFLICMILWIITTIENKKFENDMKMYEIVQKQEKIEEIPVLMNKWCLNWNTKDKMLFVGIRKDNYV